MYHIDAPMDGIRALEFRIRDDDKDFVVRPLGLIKEASVIEHELSEKYCHEYTQYDKNKIPIDFDSDAMLKDKDWWRERLKTLREIYVKYLGEGQDYSKFDDYIENFESYVG